MSHLTDVVVRVSDGVDIDNDAYELICEGEIDALEKGHVVKKSLYKAVPKISK